MLGGACAHVPLDTIVSPDGLNVYALTEAGIAVFGRRAR